MVYLILDFPACFMLDSLDPQKTSPIISRDASLIKPSNFRALTVPVLTLSHIRLKSKQWDWTNDGSWGHQIIRGDAPKTETSKQTTKKQPAANAFSNRNPPRDTRARKLWTKSPGRSSVLTHFPWHQNTMPPKKVDSPFPRPEQWDRGRHAADRILIVGDRNPLTVHQKGGKIFNSPWPCSLNSSSCELVAAASVPSSASSLNVAWSVLVQAEAAPGWLAGSSSDAHLHSTNQFWPFKNWFLPHHVSPFFPLTLDIQIAPEVWCFRMF